MTTPSPAPPIDRHKLKQAADKLAALLNDFRGDGLQLAEGRPDCWRVIPEDPKPGVYALVDNPHGYWDTTEVNGPDPVGPATEASLVDRLRGIIAEVEALTAPASTAADGRCQSEYWPAAPAGLQPLAGPVRCSCESGHRGAHSAQADPVRFPFERHIWLDGDAR